MGEPETGAPVIADPDYTADIEPIWLDQCDGCHIGAAQAGLDLSAGEGALIGVASTQQPDLMLVEPGSPARSYLWLKLTDDASIIGGAMPSGAALSAGNLGTLEAWLTTSP